MDSLHKDQQEMREWIRTVKRACRNHNDGIIELNGMYFEMHTFNRLKDRSPDYLYAFTYDRNKFVYLKYI